MTIVLNETEWAEEMIMQRSLGKKPFETMCRVARYYIDRGIPKKEVRRMLDIFLLQCDPTASLQKWSGMLDSAVNRALKYPAVDIESIVITKPEMKKLETISGKQMQRLAFTLLCLAKYWMAVNPKSDGWVNNKDSDIMRMANINTSIKRQSLMYYNLNECGMIQFSRKVDNTSVRVCFIEDGDAAMYVTDFRNLGYQYMMFHGGPYFSCQNCGITVRQTEARRGRKKKYCRECAADVATRQRISYDVRHAHAPRNCAEKTYTVYMHEFPDGKVYIGMTSQALNDRWRCGLGYKGCEVGFAIESAGWDNVRHYILFECQSLDSARYIESLYIRKKKSYLPKYGYNRHCKNTSKDYQSESLQEQQVREVDGCGKNVA